MSVRNGREFLSIPGPTTVPDRVLAAMHRPAVDIYDGELLKITRNCLEGLRTVLGTTGNVYIYAANGHGAWEAALTNCLSAGDRILVLESGLFAVTWGGMAEVLGLEVEVMPGRPRRAVDADALEQRLRNDTSNSIKAVLTVQIDTASGVVNDIPEIRRAMDMAGHDALLMVDAIASLGSMPFEMDAWGVDVAVAGSQKGLMVPPGLAFNGAGSRARDCRRTAGLVTHYWDWEFRDGPEHYMKYCGTAPEHLLFGLDESLKMLFEEGLSNVIERHRLLADTVRTAVARWCRGNALEFNITEPGERANSVTTVRATGIDPAPLIAFCRDVCGVTIGIGIGPELSGSAFRIAHMGHVNAPMVLGTLSVVETAMAALKVDHGEGGVDEAIRFLGKALQETDRDPSGSPLPGQRCCDT